MRLVEEEWNVQPQSARYDKPIGRLVMAQRMDGVLQLFPNARMVFAIGALAMLGLALGTSLKARRITGARAD